MPIFDPATLPEFDAALTVRHLTGGDVLFHAGDAPDGVAIISRGQLAILNEDGETDGTFGQGDMIGEIGAVSGLPRTRTVVATRDTELRVMSQAQFEALFIDYPTVGREVSRLVANRLVTEGSRPTKRRVPSTLALIAADDGVDAGEMLNALRRQVGRVAVVKPNGLEGATHAERMSSLDRLEQEHDLTVLDAGRFGIDDRWLDVCVRQADTAIVLASSTNIRRHDPGLRVLGRELRAHRSTNELVVMNPAGATDPVDAGRIHTTLDPHRLHHAKIGDNDSLDRAARLILRRGTALVLSGGGAKGMAHIGVWRALQERNVPVDAVAGVSFGALMAWGVALDYTADELHDVTIKRLVEAKGVFDATLPLVALLRGKGVAAQLSEINGERTFEQLWRPLLVSSADLASGTLVDHTTGPVWRGVRASMSIPGVFPPIKMGEKLLVDGAVRDNLPIRSTRAHHPGPMKVIAVDVGSHDTIEPGFAPEDGAISGWHQLRAKARRRNKKQAPGIGGVLMRVMDLSGAGSGGEAETMIVPDLAGYGPGDFKKMDALEQLGYDAAIAAIDS